eukprot:m51a1_g10368 putative sodium hydrogen exchanger 3 (575) ;mRNA; f:89838-92697
MSSSGSEGVALGSDVVSLAFIVLLIVSVELSILFSSLRALQWLHESTAVLVFGALCGAAAHSVSSLAAGRVPESLFSEWFYKVLFPPIIFNAGFTMKKRMFMRNIGTISLFAVFATVVQAVVFGVALYYLPGVGSDDLVECLLFGTLMACSDAIATIAVLLEQNVDPMLYSVVFGETVLNDAVGIALYRTLSKFVGKSIDGRVVLDIVAEFFKVVAASFGIGLVVGYSCAFLKARQKNLNLSPVYDISVMLLFAYFSYSLAEWLDMSGVLSLLVCAIVMSHYCWYTISSKTRVAFFTASMTLDYFAQNTVFFVLGFTLFFRPDPYNKQFWSINLMCFSVFLLLAVRAVSVFPLSLVANLFRTNKLTLKHQVVLWLCNLRGVVAMLLAVGLTTPHRQLFVNATYVCIFFTNIVVGVATKPIVEALGVKSDVDNANVLDPMEQTQNQRGSMILPSRLQLAWYYIDNKILKPLFGGMPKGEDARRTVKEQIHLRETSELLQPRFGAIAGPIAESSVTQQEPSPVNCAGGFAAVDETTSLLAQQRASLLRSTRSLSIRQSSGSSSDSTTLQVDEDLQP